VSLIFGIYASLVGIAVVFATLLAVATASEGVRRLLGGRAETPSNGPRKRRRAAAMAAVYSYMGLEEPEYPGVRLQVGESRWSDAARVEALRIGEAISDEA